MNPIYWDIFAVITFCGSQISQVFKINFAPLIIFCIFPSVFLNILITVFYNSCFNIWLICFFFFIVYVFCFFVSHFCKYDWNFWMSAWFCIWNECLILYMKTFNCLNYAVFLQSRFIVCSGSQVKWGQITQFSQSMTGHRLVCCLCMGSLLWFTRVPRELLFRKSICEPVGFCHPSSSVGPKLQFLFPQHWYCWKHLCTFSEFCLAVVLLALDSIKI